MFPKKHSIFLLLSILLFSSLFLTACGNPVAKSPPLYTQTKIQAVTHWDDMANEVADRVVHAYEERNDIYTHPIYVTRNNDLPFSIAFQNLLKTRLVSKGMRVSEVQEAETVTLEFDAQIVLFDVSHKYAIPSLMDLGLAVVTFFTGAATTPSRQELIVNTRLIYKGKYVMHFSSLSYIEDDEWSLYASPRAIDPKISTSRTIPVRDR